MGDDSEGVFEDFDDEGKKKMPYPWFAPKMQVFESGAVQDMCGEDVSFCLDAIEAGYEIWCDPRILVLVMRRLGLFDMTTEYPYMVTYRLKGYR